MNPLIAYLWPPFAVALLCGVIAGALWLRRERQGFVVAGALAAFAGAAVWHGPLGASERFTAVVENHAAVALADFEMTQVQAQLQRRPLTRQLALRGTADDFQRSELVRILSSIPGVSSATWSSGARAVPLIAQALLAAAVGFLLGLLLAYLVELRRRHNAQWRW